MLKECTCELDIVNAKATEIDLVNTKATGIQWPHQDASVTYQKNTRKILVFYYINIFVIIIIGDIKLT